MKWSNSALALFTAFIFGTSSCLMTVPVIASTTSTVTDVAPKTEDIGGPQMKVFKNFSTHQSKLLTMVYEIAKDDEHMQPQLLQGLLIQESNAGEKVSHGEPDCYGIFQLKLVAAREVLKLYPSLWDDFSFHNKSDREIISKLKHDERFNASIASKYLLVLRKHGYVTIAKLALAFNVGPSGAKSKNPHHSRYVLSVLKNIKLLESDQI